jgi:hypothetical protein
MEDEIWRDNCAPVTCPRCEEPLDDEDQDDGESLSLKGRDGLCWDCVRELFAAGDLPGWKD